MSYRDVTGLGPIVSVCPQAPTERINFADYSDSVMYVVHWLPSRFHIAIPTLVMNFGAWPSRNDTSF